MRHSPLYWATRRHMVRRAGTVKDAFQDDLGHCYDLQHGLQHSVNFDEAKSTNNTNEAETTTMYDHQAQETCLYGKLIAMATSLQTAFVEKLHETCSVGFWAEHHWLQLSHLHHYI